MIYPALGVFMCFAVIFFSLWMLSLWEKRHQPGRGLELLDIGGSFLYEAWITFKREDGSTVEYRRPQVWWCKYPDGYEVNRDWDRWLDEIWRTEDNRRRWASDRRIVDGRATAPRFRLTSANGKEAQR